MIATPLLGIVLSSLFGMVQSSLPGRVQLSLPGMYIYYKIVSVSTILFQSTSLEKNFVDNRIVIFPENCIFAPTYLNFN
jgi:hypothetical protein